jgi:hypothetical protein
MTDHTTVNAMRLAEDPHIAADEGHSGPAGLQIEFLDERYAVDPSATFLFGRHGNLEIDESPFMWGYVGQFSYLGALWWLRNLTPNALLRVKDLNSRSANTVDCGQSLPITYGRFNLEFIAGPTTYLLSGTILDVVGPPSIVEEVVVDHLFTPQPLPSLTREQRLLIAALAETQLRPRLGIAATIPPTKSVARRLGWSLPKLNRKLDYLCQKLTHLGLRNLKGSRGESAQDRRALLVEHAIISGLVTSDDLRLLEEHCCRRGLCDALTT